MKKQHILPIILTAAILTSCGSSSVAYSKENGNSASFDAAYADDYDYYEDNGYSDAEYSEETVAKDGYSENSLDSVSANSIKREMLVYSCSMSVDTLDFDGSLGSLRSALTSYGGFVENESFSDGGGGGRWYTPDEEKWQSYSATYRVPSDKYEDFCHAAESVGDLRSKNANVENVSTEYNDLSVTLEIYEAKEERYINMLADITEDEYAIAVEKELTEIQVKIAELKTRMNAIETDVAYSYVYLTLNEVREYTQPAPSTDTFGDRLLGTLKDTGSGFVSFLEGLLFLIIHLAPYLVLIGIFTVIVVKTVKLRRKKRAAAALPVPDANDAVSAENNTDKTE